MDQPRLHLDVTDVAFGGKGLSRHEGKVYFIPKTVPGDRVVAVVEDDAGRYANARVESFVTHSPLRGPVSCPYVARCGGCLWLGVDYQAQSAWKTSFVANALQRIAKLPHTAAITMHARPEATIGYRNRINLKAQVDNEGRLRLGYYAEQSHDLVPITRCAIADDSINEGLALLSAAGPFPDLPPQEFRMEWQVLPAMMGHEGKRPLIITLFPDRALGTNGLLSLVSYLREQLQPVWCSTVKDLRHAPVLPFDQQFGLSYHTQPGQFQQVNVPLNHLMRQLVKEKVEALAPASVLDVFCGSGNLSLALIDGKRYVEGVENNERAIAVAKLNLANNGLSSATYLAGEAVKHLWKVARNGERFDMVVVDPPRDGMYAENIPLLKIAPRHILYISCDPSTLARDLGRLCKKEAYRILSLDCFDFFPNTYHVESMVLLERQG